MGHEKKFSIKPPPYAALNCKTIIRSELRKFYKPISQLPLKKHFY